MRISSMITKETPTADAYSFTIESRISPLYRKVVMHNFFKTRGQKKKKDDVEDQIAREH